MESWLDLNTVNLLGRVDSRIDKEKLVSDIASHYRLGRVLKFRQIHEGFEDYNIKLETSKGIYLLKLFSQFKSFRHVKDNVMGLIEFRKAGVRVPAMLKSRTGEYVYYYETEDVMALACVMEFFRGKSFFKWRNEPTLAEMKDITRDIARINSVKFKPKGIYDVWAVANLIPEFGKKWKFLSKEDLRRMKPIIRSMKLADLTQCTKGPIHADIQRSNVLKDSRGNIRVIDFSVMEYGPIATELATFLALFCINPKKTSEKQVVKIYSDIIGEYLKHRRLSKYDLKMIPLLMKGTYAINCLAASYEWGGKKNETEETRYWIELGSGGMELMERVGKKLKNSKFKVQNQY